MKKSYVSKDDKHVYYNVSLSHYGKDDDDVQLIFDESRSEGILGGQAKDYKLQILTFQVPLSTMPLLLFPNTLSTNCDCTYGVPNNQFYEISLKIGATNYKKYVVFQPLAKLKSKPEINSFVDLRIFHIQHFIDLINKAFRDASTDASLTNAPFLYFDKSRKIIDLYAPEAQFKYGTNNFIYFNRQLWNLFDNFHKSFDNTVTNDLQFRIIMKENGDNFVPAGSFRPPQLLDGTSVSASVDFIVAKGEFNSKGYLYSSRSILFTSSKLPIITEKLPNNNTNTQNTSNNSLSIITDFNIDLEGEFSDGARCIQSFVNQNDNRYIDLVGEQDISEIDIRAFWVDNLGNINQLYLGKGNVFSMKLLFEKK